MSNPPPPAAKPTVNKADETAPNTWWSVLLTAGLLGLLLVGSWEFLYQDTTKNLCSKPAGLGATSVSTKPEAAVLVVPEGTQTAFSLGTDIHSGARSVPFDLTAPTTGSRIVEVSAGPFTSSSGGQQLPHGQVQAWAILNSKGTGGFATICISPEQRKVGPWGTFTGPILVDDTRITAAPST